VRVAVRRTFMSILTKESAGKPSDPAASIESGETGALAWPDIEEVLSDEREIAGLAMTTEAIRALIAGD
jgi:hypothetical protein